MPGRPSRHHRYRRGLPLAAAVLAASLLAGSAQADDPAPADATLAADLDALLSDSRLANAQTGVEVLDAATGQVLYARQPQALLTPASTLKTVTSTAALDLLGADYRFTTEVRTTGSRYGSKVVGDLVLRGGGDPTLLVQDLDDLAAQVAASGITTVTGRVLADGTRYDSTPLGPGWAWDDEPYSYSPQISGLTVANDPEYLMDTVQVTVAPGAAAGQAAQVTLNPAEAPMAFAGSVATGAAGSGSSVGVDRGRGSNGLALSGSIAAGAAPVTSWVTVEDPSTYAGRVFAGALARHGVRVAHGGAQAATGQEGSQPLVSHRSQTLAELVVPMLKVSNNGMAEHLTKEIGKVKGGRGDWATGIAQVQAFLRANGLDTPAGRQVDGSGLSRYDLITPAKMADLLRLVQDRPWFGAWYDALPVAGNPQRMVGGTLAARMTGTKAANNVHAKSGSMGGVDNLVGYATAPDGRRLVFAVLINDFAGTSPRPVLDAIAVRLATGPATAPAAGAPQRKARSLNAPAADDGYSGTRWEDCEAVAHC
ncbi:D-alanyl-D-alanine carboxypeptidase/D-alanyl-D-alanine-endopeptidase (penicillin-binding protein 4) [Kitasatospora sp. SolWspMP-SS2h]|uniref:D-alanyl-D-alanine carboxypeptidase/D-alanyl-D-alanine endopeptidase n=1 Tax=Kitasatospora sp. SolWspMP-SS2h TaxID=1305729 RepID=UPI000DBA24CF|nr:D-alanyl-D-alanine carboxypeptidase/D-alanyl-D-alanine-endopeptidase [Kitasatospora sp. SolWspMP-SS2h]RAJ43533.1 D-alanyl-D-alanine carboxypeptidase/D-alanyl-D-alanine-endopeptidase (penicillin-binding protein 4) [Kitasatospora sp. SolWspMP-SS2h]